MSSYITRVERAGSVFARVTGLMRAGQMTWNERPLWYDSYVLNPPLTPPDWNVRLSSTETPVRKLFYADDPVRAIFFRNYRELMPMSAHADGTKFAARKRKAPVQLFIDEWNAVKQENPSASDGEIEKLTVQRLGAAGVRLHPYSK